MRPHEGLLLRSRYRLVAPIATGGMGQVWRAVDEVLGRDVAVKVLKDEFVDDPTFLARFRAEARAAAPLTHPGIAQVFDYGEGEGSDGHTAYLVMELVPGEPLSALLAREGRLGTARTLDLVAQAAEALHVAHTAGVVHRDVKPGNLLVTPEGAVRVTDFGIARAADAVPLTQTGTVLGTAHYLSPEQASGRPVTPASDVYALGVVAYECITGRRLFEHSSAVAVALAHAREEAPALPDEVPVRVRELVASCLAKDPAARPASAAALAAAATRLRADVGPEAGLGALGVALPPAVADAAPDRAVLDLPTTAYAQPSGIGSAAVGSAAGSSTATRALSLPHADPPTPPAPPPPGPPAMSPRGASAPPPARPRRRGRAAVLALLMLAAAVAAALLVWSPWNGAAKGRPAAAGPLPSTTPTAFATVLVDERALRGKPLPVVRGVLEGLGLRVSVREVTSGGKVGTVADVTPSGRVRVGSTVVVEVVRGRRGEGGSQSSTAPEESKPPTKNPGQAPAGPGTGQPGEGQPSEGEPGNGQPGDGQPGDDQSPDPGNGEPSAEPEPDPGIEEPPADGEQGAKGKNTDDGDAGSNGKDGQ